MPKPLNFVGSTPVNGATGVSTGLRTIVLRFDKNVVDDSVWANNRRQITMTANGRTVAIRITRSSIAANRRFIYVKPVNLLSPSTNYRVRIGANLLSKAGVSLGRVVVVRFRTGSGR